MIWIFLLLSCSWAAAQDLSFLLSPVAPQTQFSWENTLQPQQKVKKQDSKTKMVNSLFRAGHTIKTEKLDYVMGTQYQHLDLDNEGILRDYYQYQLSLGVKKNLANNKFWIANVNYGTASDRPFKNADDSTLSVNYIRKLSEKWFFVGNYSNNRAFLNNIPLPGFFYVKEATRDRMSIFGFPFAMIMRRYQNFSFRYFGLLPWRHDARVSYTQMMWLHPYLAFKQDLTNFFRHDRDEKDHRTFFIEKKIGLGLELFPAKGLKLDVFSGHSFDREIFEAKNYGKKSYNKLRFVDSLFLETKLNYSF